MVRKHTKPVAKPAKKPKRNGRGPAKQSANHIRAWRLHRGFATQGDLAKKSGITRATISRLESGTLPYRQWQLEKLSVALDCKPHDLIGTDPNLSASIFQIYQSLSEAGQKRAIRLLQALADES
jgi:DNA-binding Xre family transcriptional regulator